jgi:hypothetical protein
MFDKLFNPSQFRKRLMMQFHDQTKLGSVLSQSNVLCHRRVIVRDGLIDVTTLSRQQSTLIVRAWIPASIPIVPVECFSGMEQFHSISFEGDSRLTRIQSRAFSNSSLRSIMIPCSVEILGPSCFRLCGSLSSISFESPSHLRRIESDFNQL